MLGIICESYSPCIHVNKDGCAVLEALGNDEILEEDYEHYLQLFKEKAHFESSVLDRKQ